MPYSTCPVCGDEFELANRPGRPRTYCGKTCAKWASNHLTSKTCTTPGCSSPLRANGMCTNHYNRARYPEERRHPKVIVSCAGCGVDVLKAKSNRYRPVCSDRCKYFVTYGRWPASRDLIGPIAPSGRPAPPPTQGVVPSTRRGFLACVCKWCGDGFIFDWRVSGVPPATCSVRCSKRRQRRKGGRFVVPDHVRAAIYERDGWRCGLCGDPVTADLDHSDLWSATLDHIVPRSKGGPDAPGNLQLAHRWCNSVINDRSGLDSDFLLAG